MRKLALLAVLLTTLPLAAEAQRFRAVLHGYQEVPAVNTQADGIFEAQTRDGPSLEYVLAYEGLQATVTQAHIHFAQRSVNGPIVVWLCGTTTNPGPAGTPTCPQSGRVSGTITAANVLASPAAQQLAAGAIDDLIAAMRGGAAYVNIHTAVSTGGEIRGQISRLGHR
jgi:hypothetical protein